MVQLPLHSIHQDAEAVFTEVNGCEVVAHYGDWLGEYATLRDGAAVLDLSFRGRLCLLGADAQRFLNGQVTNNAKDLKAGEGCYAALVSAKGKLQSDLNIYRLENELLLDFEPGLAASVTQRLEKYVVAEDVQIVDASGSYGLLSVQGPKAAATLGALLPGLSIPSKPMGVVRMEDQGLGEIYVTATPRQRSTGFDVFIPLDKLQAGLERLLAAGGRLCGWQALETARIEAALPRFGADMDETNLAPEALDTRAISYAKGCYIGQEVIARVRTYGQVAKSLRQFRISGDSQEPPARGTKIFSGDKEAGHLTSAVWSPQWQAVIALGYLRREFNQPDAKLELLSNNVRIPVEMMLT